MNDFDPTLDEIVSAYVDGAATPDERARVESDPALVERAATFRAIHDAVASPDAPADDDARRALIRRALSETAPTFATVHTLRSRRATTLGPIVAAAAVITMFFGLGALLVSTQDSGSGDESSATAAQDSDSFDAAGQLNAAGTTAPAADGGRAPPRVVAPTAESAKAVPTYLGEFADSPSLRQAVISARDGSAPSTAATSPLRAQGSPATCRRTDPVDATIYTANLRGRPVTVVVTSARLDMFDDATCVGPENLLLVPPPLTFGDPGPTSTTR